MVTDNSYSSHSLCMVMGLQLYLCGVVMGLQLYLCGDGAIYSYISVVMGLQLYLCGDGAVSLW